MSTLMLEVPESLFKEIQRQAANGGRTVEAVALGRLAVPAPGADKLEAGLRDALEALDYLDDDSLWREARARIPERHTDRLADLHEAAAKGSLAPGEAEERARLQYLVNRTMLLRAKSATLLQERGNDISSLVTPT